MEASVSKMLLKVFGQPASQQIYGLAARKTASRVTRVWLTFGPAATSAYKFITFYEEINEAAAADIQGVPDCKKPRL
jgi:hypothetical protein